MRPFNTLRKGRLLLRQVIAQMPLQWELTEAKVDISLVRLRVHMESAGHRTVKLYHRRVQNQRQPGLGLRFVVHHKITTPICMLVRVIDD